MFTNIPIQLAINCITNKWLEIKTYTDIPLNHFIKAIEITLNSTYF